MTKPEAHLLLDAARTGADIPTARITEALRMTGDVEDDDPPVQLHRSAGTWERPSVASLFRVAGPFDGLAA